MPLVTLREGVQPLVFPTDLSVEKQQQQSSRGTKTSSTSSTTEPSDQKATTDCTSIALKSEPSAASSPNSSNNNSSSQISTKHHHKGNNSSCSTTSGGKLKHLTEEEATVLMLKAVAEKQAAAANSSADLSFGEDNANSGGNSSDYPSTLSGAVAFADVSGPAGLCHINILNSISAMNNLISGSTAGSASGVGSNSLVSASNSSSNSGAGSGSLVAGSGVDNGAGHPCPVCGRVYKLKSSLRNHQKWECGKEPQFQCPFCVYRAKQKMHIGRHMERMHKEKFKLEDVKNFTGADLDVSSGGGATTAAAVAAAAAAAALVNAPELHTHFS